MSCVIKADMVTPLPATVTFTAQKTMYDGKNVSAGEEVFLFSGTKAGATGLVARGTVVTISPVPRDTQAKRTTPRVTLSVRVEALASRPLGRAELKSFDDWQDGRPQTELNFKFYRQATDKVCRISDTTAAFLRSYF